MVKDISPEEKLLKLIKDKKNKPSAPDRPNGVGSGIGRSGGPVTAAARGEDGRISGILKSGLFRNKFFEPEKLRRINKYLVVILGILALYLLIDLLAARPGRDVRSLVSRSSAAQGGVVSPAAAEKQVVVKDYSSYSGAAASKAIFGSSGGEAALPEDVGSSDGISGNVGLVGIITGAEPQAIIEDKKAQKTYYLSKGQSFNGYAVEEISEGKVILDYEGRKMSLFL